MEEESLGEALAGILVNFDGEDMEGYVETVNSLFGMVIVSALLTEEQILQLLEVFRKYRRAIGWTIVDIRGIPSGICEHNIQLEEDNQLNVEHQRRLNENMQEVVKKEIIKWLDTGVVYPTAGIKGVRSFLGHAGFYRRFIKDLSKITNPMFKLLEKEAKFVFDDKCRKAFDELKERLTTAPIILEEAGRPSNELDIDVHFQMRGCWLFQWKWYRGMLTLLIIW
ncbi:uncharacterized protein LOC132631020 [Lycium barbarum]|uniref:uncharacterized protein LOC132631020 n=1 Tax=Lycium barbarum TaxID=112863 RepID=UPI00293F09ED|nr:uncharacterized protein LOC132631020 [Lycium barbarum]